MHIVLAERISMHMYADVSSVPSWLKKSPCLTRNLQATIYPSRIYRIMLGYISQGCRRDNNNV